MRINVFALDGQDVYPIQISNNASDKLIDLLYYEEHHCWIKSLCRAAFIFIVQEIFWNNIRWIASHLTASPPPPKKKKKKKNSATIERESLFAIENYPKKLKLSFVIFVDFESLTKPVEIQRCNTHAYQEHELCAYAFKILSTDVKYTQLMKLYRGKNAVVHFLKSLKIEFRTKGLFGLMQKGNDMIMTKEDQILFEKATHCHICEKELDSDKVRDHDHISGKFRGAAHDKCNLNYHPPHRIPIIIHNLRSYDSHLIVKAPGEFPKDKIY